MKYVCMLVPTWCHLPNRVVLQGGCSVSLRHLVMFEHSADEIERLQQAGVTREQMEDPLREIRVDAQLKRSLQILSARGDAEARILSDANTW